MMRNRFPITFPVVLVTFTLFSPGAWALDCLQPNSTVALSGTIHMRTIPPDPDINRKRSVTYPVMMLDHPVCVLEGGFGAVPNGRIVSVVFGHKATLAEGQHVVLRGQLAPPDNALQPQEPLMLFVP